MEPSISFSKMPQEPARIKYHPQPPIPKHEQQHCHAFYHPGGGDLIDIDDDNTLPLPSPWPWWVTKDGRPSLFSSLYHHGKEWENQHCPLPLTAYVATIQGTKKWLTSIWKQKQSPFYEYCDFEWNAMNMPLLSNAVYGFWMQMLFSTEPLNNIEDMKLVNSFSVIYMLPNTYIINKGEQKLVYNHVHEEVLG